MDTGDKILIGAAVVVVGGVIIYAVSKLSHPTVEVGSNTWAGFFGGIGSIVNAAKSGSSNASDAGNSGHSGTEGGWAPGGGSILDSSDYSMPKDTSSSWASSDSED